ncbi:endonuclease MutS2 [Clostridium thermobutyricum]|uniref:Endonuclease MutS2 n=1 Tax=Clostridium thermobutyricum DSM 4928 TaxID=1121339 RepID=A0A1V4SVB9_9CLOT|nr:endonuclease MutS2 [Clostridium thermobutyricum]OPX47971.1 endonuclease MutS2 [Clostridium thermobutyricum DSM 4928]
MNSKASRVLEFNKVLEELKKYSKTVGGRRLIENLKPYKTEYEALSVLNETKEALEIITSKGAPPFEGLHDVRESILRASKGGVLTPGELMHIGGMLRCARNFKDYVYRKEEEKAYEKIEDLVSILKPIPNLEKGIENAIIGEDEISDKASTTLYKIRRELKERNYSVRDKINYFVKKTSEYLQDSLYTMRGDRYVLPVRAEFKSKVPGIVHDQSSTGATVFIEPMEIVNLNNEIKELTLKEKAEINKILTNLSNEVGLNKGICNTNNKILGILDFIFARGAYASDIDGTMPKINKDRSFNLISARHPLIDKKEVVASDIYLQKGINALMITGPNTGGKTVTLKTIGLLHIMALSGLLIPVMEGSSIGMFDEIFADIGDEQSIEQSLSTFSSHMTNIVKILEEASEGALVLFDELGAGTDPVEGAALAVGIVEELKARRVKIALTTHYSELKGYALETEDVQNASVEFDVKTLKPTYRLIIGIPGKSNAFEISRRLGLEERIIDKAKQFVSEDNMKFEELISELQEKSIKAQKDARDAEYMRNEAALLKKKYEEKLKRVEVVRDKTYDEARVKAKEIIREAKEEADEILKAMRELEKMGISGGGRNRLEEERKKLKDSLEKKEKGINKKEEEKGEKVKDFKLGMEVYLPSLNQNVILLSQPDSKGEVQVEAGIMKISVKAKDLRMIEGKKAKKEKKKRELKLNIASVETSVDLRGLDSEEACYKADKYLDDAYRGNLGEVTIVHGKGTGVLRKAINDMLKRHPHVKEYRLGVYGEGGDGVTVVTLK